MSLLGTSISGLTSSQRALETTSHNIANVNKDGYSRQRVELGTRLPQYTGGGYVGQGADVNNITRSHSEFLNEQLRDSASVLGEVKQYSFMASQIDDLLADPDTGVAPALSSFFNSVGGVADDPSSTPARQVMLTESEILVQRLHTMGERFDTKRDQLNTDLKVMLGDLNSAATAIADLNVKIVSALGKASDEQQPNDLMDERDQLLLELSEKVDINILQQADGSVSVFLGQGQAIVLNAVAYKFGTQASEFDPNRLEITLDSPNSKQVVTSVITGGEMAGLLRFRDEVLDPAQKKLGMIAAGLAMDFNQIHQNGYDLDGAAGERYFDFGTVEVPVLYSRLNTGAAQVTVTYSDPEVDIGAAGRLDFSDYTLEFDGANYSLIRNADKSSIALTATAVVPATVPASATLAPTTTPPDYLPGILINITTDVGFSAAAGDSFLVRPSFEAANKINTTLVDARKIAAATNVEVDPVTGQDILDGGGNPIIINGPMPGDNRNAILLANLINQNTLSNGASSYADISSEIISDVGTLTHAAKVATKAQEVLFNHTKGEKESLTGVNLDEEAANLIKFQQSYQAAAQAISISSAIFDALIGAVRS